MHMQKKRIIISFVTIAFAVIIISLTFGKEIMVGKQPSLFSFTLIHFAGYLFFILLPVETIVPYYQAVGHDGFYLVLIAVSTGVIAQVLNFLLGRLISSDVINNLIGQKQYHKAEYHIQKYGSWAVFIFNLLPLASAVLSFVAGVVKFSLRKQIIYSFLGLLIKYVVMVYVGTQFLD